MWYLYSITNWINGKQYIGIATNVGRRWIEHKCGHGSKLVYQAIQKYGIKNFAFDVLYEGDESSIKQLEVILIEQLNAKAPHGYNLTGGGEGSTGWKPDVKTRRKMSQAHKGKRNGMYGRKHNEEAKERIRAAAKGRSNPTRAELNRAYKGSANPRARTVRVNGKIFPCLQDAAKALGIKAGTLRQRFSRYRKSGDWPIGWGYVIP